MPESLYRKYRPQVFEEVVGQEHIERTLKNAIEKDQVSHAYLFCGPRGTGKTTTARLLAKALLCEKGPTPTPDGTCEECVAIAEGTHPDVYELDAASRTGVENVRDEIIGRVQYAPTRGKVKVYIIDEVHMLSIAAFNALLKTLEEPPEHVVFILCTTDPQKVPATIQSRCQRFDFHRLSNDQIVSRLGAICVAEDVKFEGDALELIAHRAEGGMRNALTSLEQLISFGAGTVTLKGAESMLGSLDIDDMSKIMHAIGTRDATSCFKWVAEYIETGADLAQFTRDMADHVRNMYVMSLTGAAVALDCTDSEKQQISKELPLFGIDRLGRLLMLLGELSDRLRTTSNQRLCFEIALTRMIRPDSDLTLESLAERIEVLESQRGATSVASAQAPIEQRGELQVATPSMAVGTPSQGARVPSAAAIPRTSQAPMMSSTPATNASATRAPQGTPSSQPCEQQMQSNQPSPMQQASAQTVSNTAPTMSAGNGSASGYNGGAGQEAASSAPAGTGSASGSLSAILTNPPALQRMWRSTINAIKKIKMPYSVLFLNANVRPDNSGSQLLIEFPVDNKFAFTMIRQDAVRQTLEDALKATFGEPVPYRCLQAKEGANQSSAPMNQPVAPVRSVPTAQAAVPSYPAQQQTRQTPSASPSVPAPQPAPAAQPAQPVPQSAPEPQPTASTPSAPHESSQKPVQSAVVPPVDEVPIDAYAGAQMDSPERESTMDNAAMDTSAASHAGTENPSSSNKQVLSSASQVAQSNGAASESDAEGQNMGTAEFADVLSSAMGANITFKPMDDK
ncbi:MAG: DNA polymerase III subunit gamma/tau [Eggerthellaceae bacterium]|nr:DNA polymerase III subunit gamma/tau [Eggerthellaceae bacterium]MCH4221440.1 DNA polymerase III subunit gamma/tau [Eggerthellaceae bacterium]